MALDLLDKVISFEIKHKPGIKLQLRMGVHCGQVVCGVVGIRIPHSSVLGDTVEIAGLMESTGQPMMIQITENVKQILDRDGSFVMTARGKLNVTLIGEIETYWLIGRKEFKEERKSST